MGCTALYTNGEKGHSRWSWAARLPGAENAEGRTSAFRVKPQPSSRARVVRAAAARVSFRPLSPERTPFPSATNRVALCPADVSASAIRSPRTSARSGFGRTATRRRIASARPAVGVGIHVCKPRSCGRVRAQLLVLLRPADAFGAALCESSGGVSILVAPARPLLNLPCLHA